MHETDSTFLFLSFFVFSSSFPPPPPPPPKKKVIWRRGDALHKLCLNLTYIHVRGIFVSCFIKLITNHTWLVIWLTCYVDIITSTKGYKNHTLQPLTKNLNTQVYSLEKQCSFHIFLIGTGTDPLFRYQDSQEWQQSSPQSPKPYSPSHAQCKSKKIFSWCLTLSCDDVPSN